MIILRWMSRHTRNDKFRNDYIREKVGVSPIEKKITEIRLRWFRYVQRRPLEAPVRKIDQIVFSLIKRGKGKPKKTLRDVIKRNLWLNGIFESLIRDKK